MGLNLLRRELTVIVGVSLCEVDPSIGGWSASSVHQVVVLLELVGIHGLQWSLLLRCLGVAVGRVAWTGSTGIGGLNLAAEKQQ